ncbi:TIGR03943 family putative permease subunit [Inediibacterium massiliense]|uniref:TIGR03943 family putative permease subunit n=1 Tax=Inediibacterium massiliense TaxID=1658111 RepID=UPI0006B4AE18|nr:TIGR03943 family protein [Inediibacterium massiliense]
MKIKLYRVNINVSLKILVLFGFAYFYIYSVFTGLVRKYVHPRMIPYMICASIIMGIIVWVLLGELFRERNIKENSWTLLFFIIPLIMAITFPAKTFDSSIGTAGDLDISSETNITKNTQESFKSLNQKEMPIESSVGNNKLYNENTKYIHKEEIELQNGIIVIDSSNYYQYLNEIYENIDKYEGNKIEIVGFVFKDNKEFADNEFVPARLMMVCCAADMVPVGFLCRYEKAKELEVDSWVKVKGTICKEKFQENNIPFIEVISIEEADKPKEEYVYPY